MAKTLAERLKEAKGQVEKGAASASADRNSQVNAALGNASGQAPAIVSPMAKHIATIHTSFGRKSIAEVLGVGVSSDRGTDGKHVIKSVNFGDKAAFRHIDPELKSILLDLKKKIHNAQLMQQIIAAKTHMPVDICTTEYFRSEVEPVLKDFNLAGFSAWVPTVNTSFFFEEFEIAPALEKFFEEVTMNSLTETVPGAVNRMKATLESDSAVFTRLANTQSSYTWTAQDCVAHTDITEDLMQDMVPQAGAFDRLRKEVMLGIQRSREDAFLNGDDSAAAVQGDNHMDSDTAAAAATNFNKAWKGLRKRAIAAGHTVSGEGQAINRALLSAMLAYMGKFGKDKSDLLLILGPSSDHRIVTGSVPELLPMYSIGGQATLVTGQVPKIFGIEPYCSEWVREDLNDQGVYAAESALTNVLLVKKSRFLIGKRAPVRIWATPSLASSDKMLLTAKERVAFSSVPQSATEISVVNGINVAK